jgi:hypothetical protein
LVFAFSIAKVGAWKLIQFYSKIFTHSVKSKKSKKISLEYALGTIIHETFKGKLKWKPYWERHRELLRQIDDEVLNTLPFYKEGEIKKKRTKPTCF